MNESNRRSQRVPLNVPILVRGMSAQNKFFEEKSETVMVSKHGMMTRLRNLLDLETEIYLVNLKNKVSGTYRVVWVNTHETNGFYNLGLEMLETDGDPWEIHFPSTEVEEGERIAEAWLECRRCHKKILTAVPEAEYEFLNEGFTIARHCERCKSTTPWEFTAEGEPEPSPPPAPAPAPLVSAAAVAEAPKPQEVSPGADKRNKGRAPIKMHIKVTRTKYGTQLEDLCETLNVSRNGAYFLTSQNYDLGEALQVVMPHKEGDLAIPVPARVVRKDEPKESYQHAVAIHLEDRKKAG